MPSTLKREDEIDKQAKGMFDSHPGLRGDEIAAGKASAEDAAFDDIAKNYNQSADPTQENTNIARAKEQNPSNASWTTSTEGMGADSKVKVSGWRKRSAGILIALGLAGGGLGVGFIAGPATMLVNLMENLATNNDSSSVAMERRFLKVFGKVTAGDQICRSTSKNLKCKFGRISNKALKKLEKKGVYAIPERTKSTGYPDKNPTHYRFDGHPDPVPANELRSFLGKPENRDLAAKVLGRGGAFNVRFAAWRGSHMKLKFWDALKLSRDGGHADGKNADLTDEERRKKLESKVPDSGEISTVADRIGSKMTSRLDKAKKGGTAYMATVAGCIAVRAPRYVAGGVAAIQLAQIASMVNDNILSPGSKLKANAIQNNVTPDDVNFLGTTLTEQTKNSEGKMTSATDSSLFKQALGIEKNKTPTNMEFAPGGGVLSNKTIMASIEGEEKTKSGCDTALSSEAMYTAAGVDAAVTVAASATIIGGIIKVAGSWAISEIISKVVAKIVKDQVPKLLAKLAKNDKIPKAQGEALGDIFGLGAMGFFSAGGMAHHLPTLKTSQLASYDKVRQDSENFQREMDIASLSPFDTSSQYTFLGSIIHSTQTAMIANGANTGRLTSLLSSITALPALTLSPTASADTGFSQKYCGYAKEFDMSEEVAINAAGTPCTGLTEKQANMSTDKALASMGDWIDDSKEVADNATIQDLVEEGVIKDDTPLRDYIDTCGNPASGDYLFNADSCTIDCGGSGCAATGTAAQKDVCITKTDSEGNSVKDCGESEGVKREVEGVKDTNRIAAIPTFLVDYQLAQSLNGEDEESVEGKPSSTGDSAGEPSADAGPIKGGWVWPIAPGESKPGPCYGGSSEHAGMDINSDGNGDIFAMRDGEVVKVINDVSGSSPATGNHIMIKTADPIWYGYQHLTKGSIKVKVGDKVTAGQILAKGGKTGNVQASSKIHLHITMASTNTTGSYGNLGTTFDPMRHLKQVKPAEYNCY
ncbi:MAG TPA: M23 family metallopeptidase [Candidatus Saccharimonadales bacterium]